MLLWPLYLLKRNRVRELKTQGMPELGSGCIDVVSSHILVLVSHGAEKLPPTSLTLTWVHAPFGDLASFHKTNVIRASLWRMLCRSSTSEDSLCGWFRFVLSVNLAVNDRRRSHERLFPSAWASLACQINLYTLQVSRPASFRFPGPWKLVTRRLSYETLWHGEQGI